MVSQRVTATFALPSGGTVQLRAQLPASIKRRGEVLFDYQLDTSARFNR